MKLSTALAAMILASGGYASNASAEGAAMAQAQGTAHALHAGANANEVLGTSFDGGATQDPSQPVQAGIANGDGAAPRANMTADLKQPEAVEGQDVPTPGEIEGENPEKKPSKWQAIKAGMIGGFIELGVPFGFLGMIIGCAAGPWGAVLGAAAGVAVGIALVNLLQALG